MGFSLSAAAAIIGVSIVISIEIFVSTSIPTITEVHDSYDEMRDRSIDQIQTDITITNTAWVDPNTEITVNNTGSITVNTSKCNVLLNGEEKIFTCTKSNIHPEGSAVFSISGQVLNGDIIKIVTPNGVSDYYKI